MKTNRLFILAAPVLAFITISPLPRIIVLTDSNYISKGWTEEQVNLNPTPEDPDATKTLSSSPYIEIVCDPITYPLSVQGSVKFTFPVSEDPILRRTRLRCKNHSGAFLNSISSQVSINNKLSYRTYILHNTNQSNIALVLQIDNNGDNEVDCNIAFDPTVQSDHNNPNDGIPEFPDVTQNIWQEWDASIGWWQVGIQYDVLHASLANPKYFTLGEYLEHHPNARILDGNKGPSIRFTIGGDSTDHDEFVGFLDAFKISKRQRQWRENTFYASTHYGPIIYDFKTLQTCEYKF